MQLQNAYSQPMGALLHSDTVPKVAAPQTLPSFHAVLSHLEGALGGDVHKQIGQMQQHLASGQQVSTRELLLNQLQLGHFSMRVELVAKIGESAMATVRKFQSQQ